MSEKYGPFLIVAPKPQSPFFFLLVSFRIWKRTNSLGRFLSLEVAAEAVAISQAIIYLNHSMYICCLIHRPRYDQSLLRSQAVS